MPCAHLDVCDFYRHARLGQNYVILYKISKTCVNPYFPVPSFRSGSVWRTRLASWGCISARAWLVSLPHVCRLWWPAVPHSCLSHPALTAVTAAILASNHPSWRGRGFSPKRVSSCCRLHCCHCYKYGRCFCLERNFSLLWIVLAVAYEAFQMGPFISSENNQLLKYSWDQKDMSVLPSSGRIEQTNYQLNSRSL